MSCMIISFVQQIHAKAGILKRKDFYNNSAITISFIIISISPCSDRKLPFFALLVSLEYIFGACNITLFLNNGLICFLVLTVMDYHSSGFCYRSALPIKTQISKTNAVKYTILSLDLYSICVLYHILKRIQGGKLRHMF